VFGSLLLHAGVLLALGITITLPTVTPRPGAPSLITARLAPAEPRSPAKHARSSTKSDRPTPSRSTVVEHSREPSRAASRAPAQQAAHERGDLEAARNAKTLKPSPTTVASAAPAASVTDTAATPRTKASPDHTHTASVNSAPPARTASVAQPAVRGAAVRAAVKRALRARFYYPYVARRNGWQGEIDLGLHISADGRISRVHVVKSSGHRMLDRAALDSARSIKVLPELVDLLYGQALDLVLPVRYRLYDG